MDNEIPNSLLLIRQRVVERPRFRGVLHTWCFSFLFQLRLYLFGRHHQLETAFAAFAFSFGISSMLGISALFHRTDFDDRQWLRFRRLDHVGIYFCIAGGYTPIGMLVVDGWLQLTLLISAWAGVGVGCLLRFLLL